MYLKFNSTAEAHEAFKRCRRTKDYILTDEAIQKEKPVCAHCKVSLLELPPKHPDLTSGYVGNRVVYSPKLKRSAVMHYMCAWESVLDQVFALDV